MRTAEQHLLPRLGIERAKRVVRTADRHHLAIGRPARSIQRVVADHERELHLALAGIRVIRIAAGDVPNLQLAEPPRRAARYGQSLAIGSKSRRLDPLRLSD